MVERMRQKQGSSFSEIEFRQAKNSIAKPRKRPSKHERLLKALLKCHDIIESKLDGDGLVMRERRVIGLTDKQEKQLIAIKRAMDKKGGGK